MKKAKAVLLFIVAVLGIPIAVITAHEKYEDAKTELNK